MVNLASILRSGLLWEMSDEDWDAVLKVHLYGYFYCSRAAVREMLKAIQKGKQPKGRVINFTSHSGILGSPKRPNYCAAKGGVVGLTYQVHAVFNSDGKKQWQAFLSTDQDLEASVNF